MAIETIEICTREHARHDTFTLTAGVAIETPPELALYRQLLYTFTLTAGVAIETINNYTIINFK